MLASTTGGSAINRKFSVSASEVDMENSQQGTSPNLALPPPPKCANEEDKSRGRRMMGVLMGTLSKFKSDECNKNSEANLKRILLEQKLAQKLLQAKEHLQETAILSNTEDSTKDFASQISHIKTLTAEACGNFTQTTSKPHLYFKRCDS